MQHLRFVNLLLLFACLAGCSTETARSSFELGPGRRAVVTLLPTVKEILLVNRGPATVEMDLEDHNLNIFMALTFRSGDRHAYRKRSLARIRFANDTDRAALIEFTIWGAGEAGFDLDLAPAPVQPPLDGNAP